jgi:hypothetical protein
VTGSRDWPDLELIRVEMAKAEVRHPGTQLVLVHGACDPRIALTGKRVPWAKAVLWPLYQQQRLLGADWLAVLVAGELGWPVRAYPADWSQGDGAGFARNARMAGDGAVEWLAFIGPCRKTEHAGREPHGSHGAEHCAAVAERAGIPVRRFAVFG